MSESDKLSLTDKEKLRMFKEKKEKEHSQIEEFAKQSGFNSYDEYLIDANDRDAKEKGYRDWDDWVEKEGNAYAQQKGFANYAEYEKDRKEKGERRLPYDINRECPLWLGVYIAENISPKVFESPERMPIGNPGYDFICKNGYKIDVKSSCLHGNYKWSF